MAILITGGAGFIGSNISDKLIDEDFEVIVVDNLSNGKKENINKKAHFFNFDICSKKFKDSLLNFLKNKKIRKIDSVIHNAALIKANESLKKPEEYFINNFFGTVNVLECCKSLGIKNFIFASSGGAIYGSQKNLPCTESAQEQPMNPYGFSKLMAEKAVADYCNRDGIIYSILRYSNVYGPRQKEGAISIFIDRLLKNKRPVVYGDGTQTRDFIFVGDVVDLNIAALNNRNSGIFNVSSATETSINEVLKNVHSIMKKNFNPAYEQIKSNEISRSCLSNNIAKSMFSWKPKHGLIDGLKKTIAYATPNGKNQSIQKKF